MIEKSVLVWIIAVIASTIIPKTLGLFLRDRDPGLLAGPLLGFVGGIGLWQVLVAWNYADSLDPILAGVLAGGGSLVLYMGGVLIKRANSKRANQ